ncbi:MAG TPA: TrbI/VirB10 family protein [Gammaproteobacteria bacterium]|jgi:type IV secretory pathway VirB10-like protein|nr:TrbI/VirB10 family protein [Gammaproteobacteria bacterium]
MAFDFSKLNFFSRLDARARVFVLVGSMVGIVFFVYLGTRLLSGGDKAIGPSKVAAAPAGLQSIPGGKLTSEYSRALKQANAQTAATAQKTGESAIGTLINTSDDADKSNTSCVVCSDKSANVKTLFNDWVRQAKILPEVASELEALASKDVSVSDYANELDRLVKAGKITPEQARELLEQYKKQHGNSMLASSAKIMDDEIKKGALPLDAANALLKAQKEGISLAGYRSLLQKYAHEGKLTPEQIQRFMAQYTQQVAKEVIGQSIVILRKMGEKGEITPEVLKDLIVLEDQMGPVDAFSDELNRYVSSGKLTPAVAAKILDEYKDQKTALGAGPTLLDARLAQAEAAAFQEITDLLKLGTITEEVASQLRAQIQQNVSLDAFKQTVAELVKAGKLKPEIAKLKIADYQMVKGLRDLKSQLVLLQENNAEIDKLVNLLKQGVADGLILPDEAAQLSSSYQGVQVSSEPETTTASTERFAELQKRMQEVPAAQTPSAENFAAPERPSAEVSQASAQAEQDRQNYLQSLVTGMSGQAQQLVAAWQPVAMQHKQGVEASTTKEGAGGSSSTTATTTTTTEGNKGAPSKGPLLVKAGSILFAVLDTEANSDYPDSPAMATVVDGPMKGAKLLGKLVTTKGVTGQMDRITLNFTLMNLDSWPASKTVTAYAIDPDTARTALASQVDYHYMMRFGAIMATSFMQGYGNAINNSGGTTTTGIFGTSTQRPALDPGQKLASALGQMGQTVGAATQNYINRPPTVRINAGVGIGILFMADLS